MTSIIIVSNSDNDHAGRIATAALRRGVGAIRFDFDRVFEADAEISFESQYGKVTSTLECETISGIFIHHPMVLVPGRTDDVDFGLFRSSWYNWIDWLEVAYSDACWVNRPSTARSITSVAHQLRVAASVGLTTPPTLFSSDLDVVKEFSAAHAGKLVVKSGPLYHMPRRSVRVFTSFVQDSDICQETLKSSPVLFQAYVDKAYELRVHVVRGNVLACRIDSQASERTRVDWRRYDIENTPHYPHQLDDAVAAKLIEFIRAVGIEFGIFDLIVTPDGETVFIECNAAGYWSWIETLTGLPITARVVDALTGIPTA